MFPANVVLKPIKKFGKYIVNSKYTDGIYKASKINQLVDLHFSASRNNQTLPEGIFDKDKKIIEDILESLKGDLDKELKKDYPDTRTLNVIVDRAQDILHTYSNIIRRGTKIITVNNPDFIYFQTMTDDTFNKDKILALDVDYVPNHDKKSKRTGTNQTWFPKSWTAKDTLDYIDFTQPRVIKVRSSSGKYTRKYTVTLVAHQEVADDFSWKAI